jgi:PPK2 family polyphosphate:nucleotide phosphotransferase
VLPKDVIEQFRVKPGKRLRLKDLDTAWAPEDLVKPYGKKAVREKAEELLAQNVRELAEVQNLLYASDTYAVLLIFQAMDAAGKDGAIKHVMSGVNPQGVQVFSFKHPSAEELDHNFLWRYAKAAPERGRIGIFNRSYYEEVLIVRVHPRLVAAQRIPGVGKIDKNFWRERFEDINAYERHLVRNGTVVLKFFLHLSKKEQKKRFLERLDDPAKNWKFSASDVEERRYWSDYMRAYEEALNATSTDAAPWYVIPADRKWAARTLISDVVVSTIQSLSLRYPELGPEQRALLREARIALERER